MKDDPIWCLKIVLSCNVDLRVHGPRSALQPAYDAYADSQWTDSQVVNVEGYCDTPDKASLHTAVKLENVQAMCLYLAY